MDGKEFIVSVNKSNQLVISKAYGYSDDSDIIIKPSLSNEVRIE